MVKYTERGVILNHEQEVAMEKELERLKNSPEYKELIAKRSKSAWSLAFLMFFVYYGFVLIIAFQPQLFADKIGDGHTSVGIVVGLFVILFSFLITGFYVHKANKIFDPLTEKLHDKVGG